MILFVGDTPSKRTNPAVAFQGAACEKRLMSWINDLDLNEEHLIINRTDRLFHAYKNLAKNNEWTVIALGNNASKALLPLDHFILPHPSGRNRKLNNKAYVDSQLHYCRLYIFGRNT